MQHAPFNWTKPPGIADDQHLCEWMGLILWAEPTGEWRVNRMQGGHHAIVLITHEHQRPGKNLGEAQRMAQAAAMSITFPDQQPQQHGT